MLALNLYVSSILLISVALLLTALAMIQSHRSTWREIQEQEQQHDPVDLAFYRRQFRRRVQMSAMLGVLAVALAAGHFLSYWIGSNWFELIFWGVALILTCWLGALAVVDFLDTKQFINRQR